MALVFRRQFVYVSLQLRAAFTSRFLSAGQQEGTLCNLTDNIRVATLDSTGPKEDGASKERTPAQLLEESERLVKPALEGGSDKPQSRGPMKPGKSGSFATPLDLVKQRMWEAGLQPAGQLSKGASEEERPNMSSPGNAGSEAGEKGDTAANGEKRSADGAGKPRIQYLEIYREKAAELKALKELTFDDVTKWSVNSSVGIPDKVKASTAAELQTCKLQLISAYHYLQILPTRRILAWAIPTEEALETIESFSPEGVIEVGAGRGYWAALLEERGVSVRAFDRDLVHLRKTKRPAPGSSWWNGWRRRQPSVLKHVALARQLDFVRVDKGGPETAGRYPERSLFLCWPPDETDEAAPDDVKSMAVDALNAYGGSTLIYVGEPFDKRSSSPEETDTEEQISKTAGPRFEQSLKEGGWELQKEVPLPNWPKCSDRLQVYTRGGADVSTTDSSTEAGKGELETDENASTSGGGEGKPESGDRSPEAIEKLREKLLSLTPHASSAKELPGEGGKAPDGSSTRRVMFSWTEDKASQQVMVDVLKTFVDLTNAQEEASRRADTQRSDEARKAFMNALKEDWDALASDLITRRVRKEWHVRKVHAPLARIEKEALERHMARQGVIRKSFMRFASDLFEAKADSV